MATPLEQLEAMRRLDENWDGYGAAIPVAVAIDLAKAFIGLLDAKQRGGLQVSPTRIGGILIEWEDQQKVHELEINPDGTIGFLHLEKATGEIQTRKFAPEKHLAVSPGLLLEIGSLLAA